MAAILPVQFSGVNHYFGQGELRKQILFGVSAEIEAGQIVIITGPSGSGKTTLITLIGALRSTQEGSLKVLGHELRGASASQLNEVRKQIGFIFQAHNLLDSLTANQNVEMSALLDPNMSRAEASQRSRTILEQVRLGDRADHFPNELSGGQKQRVAIARALVRAPRIILADEPTASLDKKTGRDVVDLMHDLAKRQGVTVLLVTHDNRILDVADRIIHLEDGRLSSFTSAVIDSTRQMMSLLIEQNRRGELTHRVRDMGLEEFQELLTQVTAEAKEFLRVIDISNDRGFESMLEQALEAFTLKIGQFLHAEKASLWLLDEERKELWSKVFGGERQTARVPTGMGIVGRVFETGEPLRVSDAYAEPLFNRAVDQETGFRTRNILAVPLRDSKGQVFGVAELLNKDDGEAFDADDEKRFGELMKSMQVLLESWWRMAASGGTGEQPANEGSRAASSTSA
jgi:putative ABC transport system ATP-binding protein